MRVNIICGEANGGWIYSQFIEQFKRHSKHTIVVNSKGPCDVTHYLPYFELGGKPPGPSTSWHSHQELKNPLHTKFITAGKAVDVAISHSKKYADILKSNGVSSAVQIIPGIDLDKFTIRGDQSHKYKKDLSELKVGYIGRTYTSSSRKNEKLIKEVAALPFVNLSRSGGNVKPDDMPAFYKAMDLIISPSLVEGGSMALQESIACGVPLICYESVGVADEFKDGIIKAPYDNPKAFIDKIRAFKSNGAYRWYGEVNVQKMIRKQVENQAIERFVEAHDKVWDSIN